MSRSKRVVIVGGGITGLSAALRLQESSPDCQVTLFEAASKVGGVLDTMSRDGYLVERAADMFTVKLPWAKQLCEATGYDDLIPVNEHHRQAFLICGGKLTPVPTGFSLLKPVKLTSMMLSPLLSPAGKVRLLYERFVPPRTDESDESLASFARRRLGREVYDRIVQPLIGGIYTADPHKLSMLATLPQFPEMERQHGSLIRAAMKDSDRSEKLASGARYDHFFTPRQGFRHWIDHLANQLPPETIRTGAAVVAARRHDDLWEVRLKDGESIECDALLLATPAPRTADVVAHFDDELAALVRRIPYAGSSVVVMGCRRDQLQHPMNGFGLVAPIVEGRKILAISFSSVKFPGRAPDDQLLLRAFVGGAVQPELNDLDDEATKQVVCDEMRSLLGLQGDPQWMEVVRWQEAMPQYHVGHVELVDQIKARADAHPCLALAGAAYRGVGIPFCIRSGQTAADQLSAEFAATT